MKAKKTNKNCKSIRSWLYNALNKHIGLETDWVQNHIVNCPKCQRRLASAGKVNLAISIIKSQPHNLNLLMRANEQAIGVLKHSLRNCPKAQKLKVILPEPKLLERCTKYRSSIASTAACILILFLMKVGIFSSIHKFQSQGEKIVKNYYTNNLGQEITDDLFST